MGERDRQLAALLQWADTRDGIFPVAEASNRGFSLTALARLVDRGFLERVAPNYLRAAHLGWTLQARQHQALLCTGPDSALGARSALHRWGLGPLPPRIEVVVPRGQKGSSRGHRLIQSTDLVAADTVLHRGVMASTPVRAVIDAARWLSMSQLHTVLSAGIEKRLFSTTDIDNRLAEVARRGRPGVRTLRTCLALFDDRPLATSFERDFEVIVNAGRFPNAVRQYRVESHGHVYFLDHAWPDYGKWSECDSMLAHGSAEALRRDLERQNRVIATTGLEPLRFTYFDVHERPEYVLEILALHLPQSPLPTNLG